MSLLLRYATALVVCAVAGFAAVISYQHIAALARSHGQPELAATLLPLSVDGLILAASLVALHEAHARRPAPVLARGALWAGIGATLAANGLYGWHWGALGIAVSAWPAAAFVIAAELAFVLVRRAAVSPAERPAGLAHPAAQMAAPEPASQPAAAGEDPIPASSPRRKSRPLERRSAKVRAQILQDLASGRAVAELARQHKVSGTGMAAYRDRHAAEIAELAGANGHMSTTD